MIEIAHHHIHAIVHVNILNIANSGGVATVTYRHGKNLFGDNHVCEGIIILYGLLLDGMVVIGIAVMIVFGIDIDRICPSQLTFIILIIRVTRNRTLVIIDIDVNVIVHTYRIMVMKNWLIIMTACHYSHSVEICVVMVVIVGCYDVVVVDCMLIAWLSLVEVLLEGLLLDEGDVLHELCLMPCCWLL